MTSVRNPTECIRNNVCGTWKVLDVVVVLLKLVQMAPLMAGELVLSQDVLQRCMVGVDSRAPVSMDITCPIFQISTDCQEFSVISRISGLALFNSLWMAIPPYLSMTQPKKSFEEIVQWTGGEYKKMSRFLVGCLANSLR